MNKGNIIFVCTANSARSQMAEGFARRIAPEGTGVFSAGTESASEVHPLAVEVMQEFGIDISDQRPKAIADLERMGFELGITLCDSARTSCPVFWGAPVVIHWDLNDPAAAEGSKAQVKEAFRRCAERIKALVSDLFKLGYFQAFTTQHTNLNAILNSLSDAIVAHDLDRRIFFFSEGAARLTGFSRSEVVGRDCHDVFSPHLCGGNCSFCDGIDFDENTEKHYSTVLLDSDGLRKECDVTVIPMKNVRGQMQGVVASLHDTTNLKSLERQLGKRKSFRGIIGGDPKMLQVFQQIRDVALYDYPVHISGETGVGKELVARAIHDESARSDAPFVPVNCGALPEGLVESELFGHVKGAFSGAVRDKKGRFELAKGGTVFLDEVADLPKPAQVKILRILQEGTLEKVGGEKTVSADVRVISATNKELKQEVKRNNFRDDLYYRLNVIPFSLPPLRSRKNDILPLCEYFLHGIGDGPKQKPRSISAEAMSILMDYRWPGNVRELENAIRFAVVKCSGDVIGPGDLPLELRLDHQPASQRGPSKKLDVETVRSALVKSGDNKAKAARFLGVGRATLYRFLNDNPEALE
ncbi:MAG: PAS domain S-box protein [Proteobacteria bacterium]|nr:PAS domain S-box protein [Pseudomonadota bacterium]